MKNALNKFKNSFDTVRQEEAGDVIQNVLIIAVFVIIVGVVGKLLFDAVKAQGVKTSGCIKKVGGNIANANTSGC